MPYEMMVAGALVAGLGWGDGGGGVVGGSGAQRVWVMGGISLAVQVPVILWEMGSHACQVLNTACLEHLDLPHISCGAVTGVLKTCPSVSNCTAPLRAECGPRVRPLQCLWLVVDRGP